MTDFAVVHLPAIVLALLSVPGTLLLLVLTGAALLPVRAPRGAPAAGRIALIVPAHNEERGIARTVASVLAETAQDGDSAIIVVADNCDDATAAAAQAAGARVLQRDQPLRRGKGYALDYAFRTLMPEPFEFFVVIDADSTLDPGFLAALRSQFGAGAQAVQSRYTVLNADANWRTRLMELSLCAFNVLRPRGRDALGTSAGLLGNGFGLRRDVLEQLPYCAGSVVEDLEYHLVLVWHGVRVRFADAAVVRADMPVKGRAAATQRARWEGGRWRMLAEHGPSLARDLVRGRLGAFEPLFDLLLPPLSWHVLLLLALLVQPTHWGRVLGVAGLLVTVLHIGAAARLGKLAPKHLLVLLWVPFYVLWKICLFPAIVVGSGRRQTWVRTARQGDQK